MTTDMADADSAGTRHEGLRMNRDDELLVELDRRIDKEDGLQADAFREATVARWQFGRLVKAERDNNGGRLPQGRRRALCDLTGKSKSEIQNRTDCADRFDTEEDLSNALDNFTSWRELVKSFAPAKEDAYTDAMRRSEEFADALSVFAETTGVDEQKRVQEELGQALEDFADPVADHPALACIPLKTDVIVSIARTVAEHGFQQAVVVSHDRKYVLDGRARVAAGIALGEKVPYVLAPPMTEDQAVNYIEAVNLIRGHAPSGAHRTVAESLDHLLDWREILASITDVRRSLTDAEIVTAKAMFAGYRIARGLSASGKVPAVSDNGPSGWDGFITPGGHSK
ncbi:hypothetical protein TPB0596_33850 [Tsukamurella pulmonis]|uniref:hypothetical protein n=1 Tax=Tsukamurella pulmonis TaxID=47312 RepID=UPI001EDC9FD6|nr:hypothetical protein [Tsukamurella pulmonis]BDD83622.1 hypothetical protein TPB0596_33850 [Tsukamurella pulmonis]